MSFPLSCWRVIRVYLEALLLSKWPRGDIGFWGAPFQDQISSALGYSIGVSWRSKGEERDTSRSHSDHSAGEPSLFLCSTALSLLEEKRDDLRLKAPARLGHGSDRLSGLLASFAYDEELIAHSVARLFREGVSSQLLIGALTRAGVELESILARPDQFPNDVSMYPLNRYYADAVSICREVLKLSNPD